MKPQIIILVVALITVNTAQAEEAPLTETSRLSLTTALTIAKAAIYDNK